MNSISFTERLARLSAKRPWPTIGVWVVLFLLAGFLIANLLTDALTTDAGRDLDGDGAPDLPSLADATQVLIAGSSDASIWTSLAVDRFADELRALAVAAVDVRFLSDVYFPPSLDNEARYRPEVPEGFNMLADPYSETGLCELPDNEDGIDNEACSDASFQPGAQLRLSYGRRGVRLDASCEAFHGDDAPVCYDRNHTLFHHVSVPWLVLADQEDNTVSDEAPVYADDRSYHWQVPEDYREVLRTAVPEALAAAGIDPADVIGIATDFTACTMVPTLADGTPLNELPEYAGRPHAYVKLWKHHAAQSQADRINELAARRGEAWLPRYGGLISSEWEFAKALQAS